MGRQKRNTGANYSFVPKISATSRKIAARRLEQLSPSVGIPHFMRDIKCKARAPLAPIVQNSTAGDQTPPSEPTCVDNEGPEIENLKAEVHTVDVNTPEPEKVPFLKPVMMSKQPSVVLDDNIFTFKPKVSSASVRIVENMGTDFMARQQQHLEKQKKFIEQAGYTYKINNTGGNLSPVSRYRKLKERGYKEALWMSDYNPVGFPDDEDGDDDVVDDIIDETDENDNVNANSQDSDSAPPDSPPSKTETDELSDTMPPSMVRNKTSLSANLQRILEANPNVRKVADTKEGPYSNGNPDMVMKRHKTRVRAHHMKGKLSADGVGSDLDDKDVGQPIPENEEEDDIDAATSLSRSKTMPSLGRPKLTRKITNLGNADRLRHAKETAEKAIKMRKVFTIQGGYSAVRHSLRKRGWVEKFYRIPAPQKKTPRKKRKNANDDDDDNDDDNDDDDDDDDGTDTDSDNDQPKIAPWEEDDGVYGIMSRLVRNVNPTFIWVLKRDVIDYRFLTRDQMVNHYCKAGSFTTKVGLTVNMRSVPWFDESDPDAFYPRCYRLSHEEEKTAFIEDYRLTACMSVLKLVMALYMEGGECNENGREREGSIVSLTKKDGEGDNSAKDNPFVCSDPECTRSRPNTNTENLCIHAQKAKEGQKKEKTILPADEAEDLDDETIELDQYGVSTKLESSRKKKKKRVIVPQKCLDRAIIQCEKHLMFCNHDDIDQAAEANQMTQAQWDEMITWYYQLTHDGAIIPNVPNNILGQVENLLNRLKARWPQFDLDGAKNVWIVKPGAKSRGRGIVCYDRLEEMLKLVNSQVVRKDNKYVVQKYIERPLLVYNCKFDIRQWFLVTDWNPLTIWFYQDSYLRFCSQQFTLEDYDESIHLSNNAIQKHYKNGPRDKELPDDNMWTHDQFKDYIKSKKLGNLWDDLIYPGMKKAIVCALLSTQDLVEYRKASFELYGADFMLTDDYHPWLIEINSSPSMECSTDVTARLCSSVLEDTMKVVIDRKFDRNCDIGRFELAFKQPLVTVPPYIGINLTVDGQAIKKPSWINVRKPAEQEPFFSPRKEKQVIFNDKLASSNSDNKVHATGNTRRPLSDKDIDGNNSNQKPTTNSAPVKKSVSRESATDHGHTKTRKSISQRSPNTKVVTEQTTNESNRAYCHSEGGQLDTDVEESKSSEKQAFSPQPPLMPKTSTFGSGAIPTTSYVANLQSGKKVVSRTSVSANYTIPAADTRERPALTVNNVESTDLKTLKSQTKGVCPLIENAWNRTCTDCGNGMNLHLDNVNPFCKCRQDGIKISPDPPPPPRSRGSHNGLLSRPQSAFRSQPSPASMNGGYSTGGKMTGGHRVPQTTCTFSTSTSSKKVLLRYTDGGIKHPLHQQSSGYNTLPKLVRRYIGRRVGQCHELSMSQNSAVFLDTSQINGALSIVSHGFYK